MLFSIGKSGKLYCDGVYIIHKYTICYFAFVIKLFVNLLQTEEYYWEINHSTSTTFYTVRTVFCCV